MGSLVLLVACCSLPVEAFETDQFLTWDVILEDSSEPINRFVNQRFESVLEHLNGRKRKLSCSEVPDRLYSDLVRNLFQSKMRRFLHHDTNIDRFPDLDVGYWQYRKKSLYRRKAFPVFLPLSRTIRVGDVYLGTDKFGHFFGFGRRYYRRYLRSLRNGHSPDKAVDEAIRWGVLVERTAVGGWADGIVSWADLEANFRGFELARAMCEGDAPLLEEIDGRFELRHAIDLRRWIGPQFDESYNPNHYMYYRWRLVRPILRREVCSRLDGEIVRARFESYAAHQTRSAAMELMTEIYAAWGRRPQDRHSPAVVCSRDTEKKRRSSD